MTNVNKNNEIFNNKKKKIKKFPQQNNSEVGYKHTNVSNSSEDWLNFIQNCWASQYFFLQSNSVTDEKKNGEYQCKKYISDFIWLAFMFIGDKMNGNKTGNL